ncbi:DUF4041 domain-containing protein [Salmonella enterica subsp. enterica serovar Enteritidis]|nr:DUF4041 domain-containing protein [Salmonella enterica subsp. enterica serovar Enteritidis]
MTDLNVMIGGVSTIAALVAAVIYTGKKLHTAHQVIKAKDAALARFAPIMDAEAEAARLLEENKQQIAANLQELLDKCEAMQADMQANVDKGKAAVQDHLKAIEDLQEAYREKKKVYDALVERVGLYEEDAEMAEMGFYKPRFNLINSERYRVKIRDNRDKQKAMLKDRTSKGAIWCDTEWNVHGSRSEGKKMTTRAINLTARAFNGECDAAIASCSYKNYSTMYDRINNAYLRINQLNEVNDIHINNDYLWLKFEELDLVYEYHQKRQDEKEEQRALREQIREEERAQREYDRAIKDAEDEERRAERALFKARKQLEAAHGEERQKYEDRIAELIDSLREAQEKSERAISMAQQTKRGHVYIISNVGSFGENVFKIGLTRRLDPQDRVDELGSASVPFLFDVHAMIRSNDAPALENALHKHFDAKRVNLVNKRKEFFNVTIEEIKAAVVELVGDDVDFEETAAAAQWRETQAMRVAEPLPTAEEVKAAKKMEFAEAI